MTATKVPIAVAYGDGIGPEIMSATINILQAAGANIDIHTIEVGEKVYQTGIPTGIAPASWDIIRNTQAFLKAPITTPQGGGFKSLNVTIRTVMGLYANVRPCVAYAPFVRTKHPKMNVVIVRENEEDLYTGIEYRQTHETVQALKIITLEGCERIIRYAFEYAKSHGRKKVTCFTKDNILKFSDGLFHRIFEEIGTDYPEIEKEHWIVDIGAAKLADTPESFDVIVLPNLYGDILSDVAAQIAGSVGLAGSANIGKGNAMFEAIHGSAPRRANQNLANPSGLILASVMMLNHINQPDVAENIHNAWLCTMEEGIHTYDIFNPDISTEKVGTREFANAVIKNLGQQPHTLKAVHYQDQEKPKMATIPVSPTVVSAVRANKQTVGVDVFIDQAEKSPETLYKTLQKITLPENIVFKGIYNRGVKVWPDILPETSYSDSWRCRFISKDTSISHAAIAKLLTEMALQQIDFTHTENLCTFDGKPGYTGADDTK